LIELEPGTRGRYAALSHCWGSNLTYKTSKDTLGSRKKAIVWSDLPATFQDAITICHELDVQYMWIDSLCIIQDSDEDWEEESAKMGTIYENAWITIAATSSAGSAEHFLASRPEECNPIDLNFVDASGDTHIIHIRQNIEHPTATPNPKMVMDIQGTLMAH
jgi:hypothetical protein